MADVFISYKRDERAAIERIAAELRDLGLSVWFDAGLSAGEAFSDEIDREARSAKCILVCWSSGARESKWVKAEAEVGFGRDTLVAAYVAGPDGFEPPLPFNRLHTEDLRSWLAAPRHDHSSWRSLLRSVGRLCGRADMESFGALDAQASASQLNDWLAKHEASPLFVAVDDLLQSRRALEAERAALEQAARERRAREEAERRLREEEERRARERAEQHAYEEAARRREAELEAQAREAARARRPSALMWFGAIALVVVFLWWQNFSNTTTTARTSGPSPVEPSQASLPNPNAPTRAVTDLTGAWSGYYIQAGRRTPLSADFSGGGGRFSGNMSEPNSFSSASVTHLYALISGSVTPDGAVTFVKTYDGTGGASHTVQYRGRIDETGTTITGTWRVDGSSGEFSLSRR